MEADNEVIRTIHIGLGQIGAAIARLTAARDGLEAVGAVDVDPSWADKTLADVLGNGSTPVPVRPTLELALEDAREAGGAHVAFHAVASRVPAIAGQIISLTEAGLNVVTTAEELIHPYEKHADAARSIDDAARANGVSVFAAGVNPGFLMDRLPAYLSALCTRVEAVHVRRVVDLRHRRPALRRKMGVGEDAEEVKRRIAGQSIGHVGLVESLQYIGRCLGWRLRAVSESLEPIVADRLIEEAGESVAPGQVLGLEHSVEASTGDGRKVELSLIMRLDADRPLDQIDIAGEPPVHLQFPGGINGDQATAATVINAARFAADAAPGLIAHMPLPCGA